MSSMYSGKSHLRMGSQKAEKTPRSIHLNWSGGDAGLPEKHQHHDAGKHRAKSDKSNLPVGQLSHTPECIPPHARRHEWQYAFNNQHQSEGGKQRISQRVRTDRTSTGLFLRFAVFEVFKELRIGIEHHHIALVLETLTVRFEAAIKRIELGVLFIGARVNRR